MIGVPFLVQRGLGVVVDRGIQEVILESIHSPHVYLVALGTVVIDAFIHGQILGLVGVHVE